MADFSEPGTFTVRSVPIHDSILPVPLRWPPPYAWLASRPDGFARFWQFAEYVFRLPDPRKFPSFGQVLSTKDRETVERFIDVCRRMSQYTLMSSQSSIDVSVRGGATTVHAEFDSEEVINGFTAQFRQLYADDEKASFKTVRGIVSQQTVRLQDRDTDERKDYLRDWHRAQGQLRGRLLKTMVEYKVLQRTSQSDGFELPNENVVPTQVLSRWFYGEIMHWGDKRVALTKALGDHEVTAAMEQFVYQEILIDLTHYYMGYAVLVGQAFDLPTHAYEV